MGETSLESPASLGALDADATGPPQQALEPAFTSSSPLNPVIGYMAWSARQRTFIGYMPIRTPDCNVASLQAA